MSEHPPASPAEVPRCHSLPREQWCDRDGAGGFMGHTCKPPRPSASIDSDIEAMRRDGYVCRSCSTRVWPAPSSAPRSAEPTDDFVALRAIRDELGGDRHCLDLPQLREIARLRTAFAALTADRDRLARRVEALEADAEAVAKEADNGR